MKNLFNTNPFLIIINLIAISLIFITSSYAQNLNIAKGKIYTNDGSEILFSNLEQQENTVLFVNGNYRTTLPYDQIAQIDQEVGNEAGKWALYLGLSGLLGSALGVAQASSETGYSNSSASTKIVVGLTALSAGIGALIGYGKKKYQTVYTNPKYGFGDFLKNSSFDLSLVEKKSFVFTFRHSF